MKTNEILGEDNTQFVKAVHLFNRKEWYLAHDILEEIWHNINGMERITIQAILQIAVAELHLENGNLSGSIILYGEGYGRLKNNNLPDLGLDINKFTIDVGKKFKILQKGGNLHEVKYPKLIELSSKN